MDAGDTTGAAWTAGAAATTGAPGSTGAAGTTGGGNGGAAAGCEDAPRRPRADLYGQTTW